MLPHILLPGTPYGLHDAFHEAALEAQERLGGPNGLLVTLEEQKSISSPSSATSTVLSLQTASGSTMASPVGSVRVEEDGPSDRVRASRVGRGTQETKRMALL